MRLLVCFDGSEAALAALPVAQRMAAATDAEVRLVRVAPHDLASGGVAWSGSAAVDIDKHRRAQEEDRALLQQLETLSAGFSAPVVVSVLNGERVAEELIHYARRHAIDLIVLGCQQRRAPHRGVGGDVTSRLVESGVAPVLLGPMVPAAALDLTAVPRGCAVFSRDGFYLGDLASTDAGRIHIRRHDGGETVVRAADAFELSVASGLHLAFDLAELDHHVVPLAIS